MHLLCKRTILKRLRSSDQDFPLVLIKHSFIHHLLQQFCHWTVINKVKNELDGHPSSLLISMHVCNYNATFSPVHLVFLEDIHQPHLGFKVLDENNNEVIPITFEHIRQ